MTDQDQDRAQAFAAAERLDQSMQDLRSEIGTLTAYGRRNRRLIQALAVSLTLDAVLSIAVAVIAVAATTASGKATEATSASARTAQTQQATCEAGNQARALQMQLWHYVLDLSQTSPREYPGKQKQLDDFRAYVDRTFAPRPCT